MPRLYIEATNQVLGEVTVNIRVYPRNRVGGVNRNQRFFYH